MTIAICCLIRRGNKYVREWIEHHRSIGIDHIFLYDNNRSGEEDLVSEIKDFMNDGFVTVVEWRTGSGFFQNTAQYDCYHDRGKKYDWIAFIDSDEYLQVKDGNIHYLVEQPCFSEVDSIEVSTINYTDTGIIKNDSKHRIGVYTDINGNRQQRWYKGIMRTGNADIEEFNHYPISKHGKKFKIVDADGRNIPGTTFVLEDTIAAHIDHFPTGCIDDYIYGKHYCGWPDEHNKNNFDLEKFYYYNYHSEEKDRYWKEHTKNSNIMRKKLIFFIYIGDDRSPLTRANSNGTAAVHFKCLKKYREVFDEARFILSLKKTLINNGKLIGEYIEFINSLGYHENTEFVIEENTDLRESKSFYYEILENKENEGKLVFFGHLRSEVYDNDSLRKWVFSNYYFALDDIEQMMDNLCTNIQVFYGYPLTDCRFVEGNSREVIPKYGYYFLGTEFWVNITLLKEVIRVNKVEIPSVFGRFYSENFPASVCNWERLGTYNNVAAMTGYWAYDEFCEMFEEWCGRANFDAEVFYDEFKRLNNEVQL